MINIRLVGDREVIFDLNRINREAPGAMRQIVGRSALQVKREAMLNLSGRMLKVRSDELRLNLPIIRGGGRDNPWAIITSNTFYAPVHEFGMTIRARNFPYMTFKTDRGWRRAKQVIIPPRPFMKAAFQASIPAIEKIAEEEIQRLIR